MTDLSDRVADRIRTWRIVVSHQIETDRAVLVFGRQDDRAIVLKVVNSPGDEWPAGMIQAAFDGRGAVRVYDQIEGVVLLERAMPGHSLVPLVARGDDEEATRILARTICAMSTAKAITESTDVPTVADWGASFEKYTRSGDRMLPLPLVSEAAATYSDLAASQGPARLLHGDLHHENVIFDATRGWLAIDAKGVIGEVEYELGAALRNPLDHPAVFKDEGVIARRIRIFAEELTLDPKRIAGWAFAQSVLAAIWAIEDGLEVSSDHPWIALAARLRTLASV